MKKIKRCEFGQTEREGRELRIKEVREHGRERER